LPFNHLKRKTGCCKCAITKKSQNMPIPHQVFIEKAKNIHGNAFEYISEYISNKKYITIKCNKCNYIFSQKAYSHLEGHGCKKCFEEKSAKLQLLDYDIFLERCNKIHQNKYIYNNDYKGCRRKITIVCKLHGLFRQEAGAHMKGQYICEF
jgi:hypothetical protein